MRLFISFLLVFFQIINPAVFAGSKTIVKSDILEGNVADIDILGSNGHFERNAIGWAAYDDAAGDPVDATGGTSTTTCARSTSSPIDGDGSLLMTKTGGASYQGEGCALTFTIPANLSAEPLQITFEYAVASGTYTDDAVELWLYNATGSTLTQPAPTLLKKHSLNRQTYRAEFQPAYSTSAQTFRLALHIGATDTTAYTLKFDNFRVFKGRKSYGSPITDVGGVYTPTVTNGGTATFSTLTGNWRRSGDKADISIVAIASGAGSGASAFTFAMPSGLVADSGKYLSGLTIGEATHYSLEAATQYDTSGVGLASTTTIAITNNGAGGNFTGADIRADTQIYIKVSIPIVGWSSSVVMSSDADTRVTAATMYRTSSSQTISSSSETKVQLNAASPDTHGGADITTNYRYTFKVPGFYSVGATAFVNNINSGEVYSVRIKKNGTNIIQGSAAGGATGVSVFVTPRVISVIAGDYVEMYVQSSSDALYDILGTLDTVSYMSIQRISGPSQIAASEVVAGDWYKNGNTTYNGNAARQQILIDTASTDTHSMLSGNTVVIKTPGLYAIDAQAYFSGANIVSGGLYSVLVTKTTLGGTVLAGAESRAAAAGAVTSCTATGIRYLVTGDILYFAVSSNQNHSASTITIDGSTAFLTKISVKRLGGL